MTRIIDTINAVLDPEMTAETKEKYADLIAFGMKIDFDPLFEAIREKTELGSIEFDTPVLYAYDGNLHVRCKSANIAKHTGVFTSIMDEVYVTLGSTCITKSKDEGHCYLWAVVDFTYSLKSGGSNGNELVTVWYNEKEGWTFKFVKSRK